MGRSASCLSVQLTIVVFHFVLLCTASAQVSHSADAASDSSDARHFSPAIEDNSFLIEEAFNQETRVVQHISTVSYTSNPESILFTFTQEWPVGSQTHQLSYSIPYSFLHAGNGIGDVLLNYRYQLLGETDPFWCAPRLSLSIPTGSSSKGTGMGVFGVQFCLPASKRWSDEFISHFNFAMTSFFHVQGTDEAGNTVRKTLASFSVGASGIYLLSENFNLICEWLQNENARIGPSGNLAYSSQTIVSPGIRFAVNLPGVQIVPGFAVPISIRPETVDVGIFAYLSFEHPY
jgi:hypothetical protein